MVSAMAQDIGYWFDTSGQFHKTPDDFVIDWEEESWRKQQVYCCAVCKNRVTGEVDAIYVEGRHEHHKINPQGRQYRIRCFSTAPGCRTAGEPTRYFSWFNGHAWRFAYCGQCNAQLGWFFEGSGRFFGLIGEQIKQCDNQGDFGPR